MSASKSTPPPLPETEYSEVLTSLRHYSNPRFASLTLFSAITAGLFTAAFGTTMGIQNSLLRAQAHIIWPVIGIVVRALFLTIEFCISEYIRTCRYVITELHPNGHIARMPLWSRMIPPRIFKALYLMAVVFWGLAVFLR
jgi:hypothetical protein